MVDAAAEGAAALVLGKVEIDAQMLGRDRVSLQRRDAQPVHVITRTIYTAKD